ncbi:MAG: hypothetical protein AAF961_15775, partial [Planctomycetota bacterium]
MIAIAGREAATFFNFDEPMITANGHVAYRAGLSFDADADPPVRTFDSVWSLAVGPNPTSELQLRWGTPAPTAGWNEQVEEGETPPMYSGKGSSRIELVGVNQFGEVSFQAGRFASSTEIPNAPVSWSQSDRNVVWRSSRGGGFVEQANAGVIWSGEQPTPIELEVEHFSFSPAMGNLAYIAQTDVASGYELRSQVDLGAWQTSVVQSQASPLGSPDAGWFVDGFGRQGGYVYDRQDNLYFHAG